MSIRKLVLRLTSCRWELALLKESPAEIILGKKPHFIYIKNPFYKQFWFADPFILDVQGNLVHVLAETMPRKNERESKASISLLSIDREKKSIIKMETVLQEAWHLSFPCIVRIDNDIFVCPESAEAEKLFLYKLIKDENGKHHLIKKRLICDDVIWDSDITYLFGQPRMFTANRDNYHLDIYSWDTALDKFIYDQSIISNRQNMRMAGSIFKVEDNIYCPQQDSGYTYGNAVEIKLLTEDKGIFSLKPKAIIRPPRRLMIDGLHTFNSFQDIVIVDLLRQEHLIGLALRKLIAIKKKFKESRMKKHD